MTGRQTISWRMAAAGLLGVIALQGVHIGQAHAESPPMQLVLAIGGEPDQGYDPLLGWGQYGHPLFQSTLLVRDADLATVPDLATSWTLSDDGLEWTVTIRDDARFSDGSALTAEDVAFTFERASTAAGLVDLTVLAQAEVVDGHTVRLRLAEPRITFAESFYTLGIVPAALYGPGYGRDPVGSGPYRLVSWVEGEQLIVEANPYFHGPAPRFDRLVFLFTDEDASFAAAAAGVVDIAAVPPALAARAPQGMRAEVAQTVDNRGILFPMVPAGGTTQAGLPVGNDVTADPAIRRAVNIAIDRDLLVDVVLAGHGSPAHGAADGLPWSNPEAALPDNDPGEAARLLEAAGWLPGPDGVRVRDGLPARFRITYPASDATRGMLAMVVAEMLRPVGIEAEPTGRSWSEIRRIAHSEPVVFGWGSHNPLEVYLLHHSALAGTDLYNAGFYANPTVDAHFDAAQRAPSLEASWPHWQKAEWDGQTGFGMRGDAPWAWLVNLGHVYLVDDCLDVGRLQIEPHGHGWPITAGVLDWRWICG